MIEKIVKIADVGRFLLCQPSGNTSLKPITLVFADNGRGKTTLAAVFRSLSLDDPTPLEERKAVAGQGNPYVKLIAGGTPVIFDSSSWTGTLPEVEVFDAAFVEKNVYSGSVVDAAHRKNLHSLAIGGKGVQLAKRVDELGDNISKLNSPIATAEGALDNLTNGVVDAAKFCGLVSVPGVDKKVLSTAKNLKAAKEKELIEKTGRLSSLPIPAVPVEEALAHLQATLEDVSAEAVATTRKHIKKALDEAGEAWLRQGLGYLDEGDNCPFCGSDVKSSGLVSAYRQYFDEAYAEHIAQTSVLDAQVTVSTSPSSTAALQRSLDANAALQRIWSTFGIEGPDSVDTAQLQEDLLNLNRALLAELGKKDRAPLDSITASESTTKAISVWSARVEAIESYNEAVGETNKAIDALKESSGSADVATLEGQLEQLNLAKLRHESKGAKACETYTQLVSKKKELEKQKKQAWADLGAESATLIKEYASDINTYLQNFGAQFLLRDASEDRHGGVPRIDYCIDIDGCPVPLSAQGAGQLCFGNTLSAGDRSALAFAFFLAKLNKSGDLSKKVVVLDDPICSLDYGRRTSSLQEIEKLSSQASQVVVMSHDALFLKEIWSRSEPAKRMALRIARTNNNSSIVLCDIEQETRSRYSEDYVRLSDYVTGTIGASVEVARSIRPLLEGHLRLRFPGRVGSRKLGDFLSEVANADPTDPISALEPLRSEIGDVNDYAKEFHHDENPGADSQPVNDTELYAYSRRALAAVAQVLVVGLT